MPNHQNCPVLDLASVTESPNVVTEYRKITDTGATASPAEPLGGAEYTAVLGYDEVRRAAMDAVRLSNAEGMTIPPVKSPLQLIPVELDAPEHPKFRKFLMPQFRKDRIEALSGDIRRHVDYAIDQIIEEGQGDLNSIGRYVPPAVISAVMGVPDDAPIMVDLTERIIEFAAKGDDDGLNEANRNMVEYVAKLVAEAEGTDRQDLAGIVANAEVDGSPIGTERATATLITIVMAGQETTVHGISSLIAQLGANPDIKDELIKDPSLIPDAVEESLRKESPVQMVGRTSTDDFEIGGCPIKRGGLVGLVWGAANSDPEVFENPEEFRIDREKNSHLAFGYGVHRCIGEHLARAEMTIAAEQVLARMPDFELTGEVLYDAHAPFNRGVLGIPARFTPGPKVLSE